MPVHKLAFRVTHRFTRPLARETSAIWRRISSDSIQAAQIGLELRYGLARGTQIGVHRTSDRTIADFRAALVLDRAGRQAVRARRHRDVRGREQPARSITGARSAALVSRNVAKHAALYAEPMLVINSQPVRCRVDNNT